MTPNTNAAPDLKTVINFLMGDGTLNGFQFGETPEGAGKYWWRAELRRAALSTAAQPTWEPVAYLWQHSETGRTRVVMPDGVITADATWHVVGPLVIAAAPKAAPADVVGPVKLPFAIMDDELEALRRFDECARDFEAGGHDVRKEMMKRLAEIGLVRRVTANIYEHTTFGLSVLGGDFDAAPATQAAPKQEAQSPVVWPVMPPSKGQSPVLFEDGYAEGWAKCLEACQAALATAPTTQAAPVAHGDALDAARYRYLKKYKTWDSTDVFYWLRCAPADEVDSIIDAARAQQEDKL